MIKKLNENLKIVVGHETVTIINKEMINFFHKVQFHLDGPHRQSVECFRGIDRLKHTLY